LLAFCIQVYAIDIDDGMAEEGEIDVSSEDKTSQYMMVSTATSTIPKTKPVKTIPSELATPTATTTPTPTILPDTTVINDETLTKTTVTFEYSIRGNGSTTSYGTIATYLPEEVDDAFVKCVQSYDFEIDYQYFCEQYGKDCFFSYDNFQYESNRPCRIFTTRAVDTLPSTSVYRSTRICRKFDELTTSLSSRSSTHNFERTTINPETVHLLSKGYYNVHILSVDNYTTCVSSATSTSRTYAYTTTPVVIPEDRKVTTVVYKVGAYSYNTAVMTVPNSMNGPMAVRCITNFNNAYPYWKKREIKIDTSDRVVARAFSTKTIPSGSASSSSSKVVIQSETTTSASSRVKTIPSSSGTLQSESTTSVSSRVKTIPSFSTTTTTTTRTTPPTKTTTNGYRPPNFPQETNNAGDFLDQFGNYYKFYTEIRYTASAAMYHTTCRHFTTTKQIPNDGATPTRYDYCYVTSTGTPTTYYRYKATDLNTYNGPTTDNQYIKTIIETEISTLVETMTYTYSCSSTTKSISSESLTTSTTTTTTESPVTITTTTTTESPVISTTTTKTTKCIPEVITITEKDRTTVTEKETVTVTVYDNDTPTTEPNNDSSCAAKWAQCGGVGFKGPTCCQSGSTCRQLNDYYHQCV